MNEGRSRPTTGAVLSFTPAIRARAPEASGPSGTVRSPSVLRWSAVLVGLALLVWIASQADIGEVARTVSTIGWGVGAVLAVYFLAFVADSMSWQLAIPSFPIDARHLCRAWKVRMVGEPFNLFTPLGGIRGDPAKAVPLKRHYGVGLHEGTASVILATTVITLSLLPFLSAGFLLMLGSPELPSVYKGAAVAGLAALTIGIGLFFLIQRFRVTSLAGTWLSSRRIGAALDGVLHHIRDIDHRLVRFYTRNRRRLAAALGLAGVGWLLGVVEIYLTMALLGHPVSIWDAWIIESAVQLVRAGAFLIPAGLGAQEGTFLLVVGAMTGQPTLGLAVALVRRFRELVWLGLGAMIGWTFVMRDRLRPVSG